MRYLHVAGVAFEQMWSASEVYYASNGCVYLDGTYRYLAAPLELPYNSTVHQLRLYYNDTSPSDGIMRLAQYDDGQGYTYVVTATTTGATGVGYTTVNFEKK